MITAAVDIGGSRIKLALVREGALLIQDCIEARSPERLVLQLPRIAQALRQLCEQLGMSLKDCCYLGMAFPSLVDIETGRVLTAYGKYADAPEIDLSRWARERLGLSLVIENDARVAQLGEWRGGAGRGCDDFVMVTLGTGLGTSALVYGRLIRGRHGQAGVLGGHFTVRPGGRLCSCGNRGCVEAEASTVVLPEIARAQPAFQSSGLKELDVIDYAAVFRLAKEGDACARALRTHTLEIWTAWMVSLIHAYDPERLVVGGGIMAGADGFFPELQQRVLAQAHTPWGQIDLCPAELGDAAALVGADVLVRERLGRA